ncbi:ABC transporter ATP-binding protein [Bdellovibrio sp. NC01]|uniref:ABC transporter ATP-binding protein n=1 Tax=Bdellovibrio sp. NC01 TaxID=2220073 RepID=UPI001159F47C|nr:ABC transporter ATP-binding protein [Bdellovibrio sp. NC01]QDK39104.1 ABC transporter ATP-binding protein [Bdellovibrio sp. NC01]
MSSPIIQAENLNVHYGSIHALKGITFQVNKGEVVSLIGANGAGKTTTLRALSGLVPCTGKLYFEDQDLTKVPTFKRVGLGLAQSPEGRGVFPQMSVEENLTMGAYSRSDKGGIKQDMDMCLELFPRLKERLWQMAGTMSGGEQQMLAISRALMARPKILLLDEPSLGLAPLIVAQIFDIVKKLNQEGMTILLVEQNARMALKISHRAYVLETGKIVMQDSAVNLLNNNEVRKSYLGV